ncbi:iron-containing alcohol dehydrogenase family protein [Natrarchaeobaculum aegyptiacum]|uniref:Alcohol dehydrogenase n=1 Tax=Natrarchaeobaculum aegyptiacum TaxID=745377 RepID=A0A2Z2HTL5_9EURY|nr:iron-containing alcohol dehydrogenase [Natrarchaeobaculum aegyptiacum]ARS90571.1 alcohol dehydrogenase [Natrarchaeobaculum aegyptiacum]
MTSTLERWFVPPRNVFGWGTARTAGSVVDDLECSTVLVVTDDGVKDAGVLDPITDSLEAAGVAYELFDGTVPDPTASVVATAADRYGAVDADGIVAVGGGSSIDTAKAAAAMTTTDGSILEYAGLGQLPNDTPPLVILPTTSGTGSEATTWSVIRDEAEGVKRSIGDQALLPDAAIVDPELTESVPVPIAAATGMDALTHAIEAYVSVHRQSQTSALALDSIEKIGAFLPRAVGRRGTDREALTAMAKASNQAGMAFNGAGLGAVHALSHQVGAQFHVPHGLANAVLLPYVMEYNLPVVPEELVDVAEALGEAVDSTEPARREGYRAVRAVRRLCDDVDIPRTLEDVDADPDAIEGLAAQAMRDGSLIGNPRDTDVGDLETILERAFEGTLEYENVL